MAAAAEVNVKVVFPALDGQTKVMRFDVDASIQNVIKEIKEKINFDGADHGLFQPEVPGKSKARWLREDRTLLYYNIGQETEVLFKKKTRGLKVRLVDNTVKTVLIDDTAIVAAIRDTIGQKLGIANADEYGLKVHQTGKWLHVERNLQEQDVTDDDVLVFDKSFFYFDDVLDKSDPIQLHLLYTKAAQSILDGTYPVTVQQGVSLAGLQAQVMLGSFDPARHTKDSYKVDLLLPAQLLKEVKAKKIVEQIEVEHKSKVGIAEEDAKYKYVQAVRALPTYGISFYTVQVPHKDKKKRKAGKMTDILLGVSRENIMQLDAATKEPLREYSLVHLKRWAFVRGRLTFDFGDHEDDYWTVFTEQGDQISALISGYIDIIINARKRGMKKVDPDGEGGLAAEEDMVMLNVAETSGIAGGRGKGALDGLELVDLESALAMADMIFDDLGNQIPASERRANRRMSVVGEPQWVEQIVSFEHGTDDDVRRLVDHLLTNVPPKKSDVDQLSVAVGKRLKEFAPLAKAAAAANDDTSAVQSAAQVLTKALGGILQSAHGVLKNPFDDDAKQQLLVAKQKYDAAMLLMQSARGNQLSDEATADLIESILKAINLAVQGLKLETGEYEKVLDGQNAVVCRNYGKQLMPAAGALTEAARTLSTAMLNPAARKHVLDASDFLAGLAKQINGLAQRTAKAPEWLDRIGGNAQNVADAIRLLVDAMRSAEGKGMVAHVDEATRLVQHATQTLREANGQQKLMLSGIKEIAAGANEVIRQALTIAANSPLEVKTHLEEEAHKLKRNLLDLTEIGKAAIKSPSDLTLRAALQTAAEKVQDAVASLSADLKNLTAAANLRAAAKTTLGEAIALSQGVKVGIFLQDPALHKKTDLSGVQLHPRVALKLEAASMGDALHGLLAALKDACASPNNQASQDALLQNTRQIGPQIAKFVASTKRAEGELSPLVAAEVAKNATATQDRISKLLGAVKSAQNADTNGCDISGAVKLMEANNAQIESAQFSAMSGLLVAAGDREGAIEVLQQYGESFNGAMDALERAAENAGPLSTPSNAVAVSLGDLVAAFEGVAGSIDGESQKSLFDMLKKLSDDTSSYLKTIKNLRIERTEDAKKKAFAAKSAVQRGLGSLLSTTSGHDSGEIDSAIQAIKAELANIKPSSGAADFAAASKQVAARSKAVLAAAQQIAGLAKANPKRVAPLSKIIATTVKNLVNSSNAAAGGAGDGHTQKKIGDLTRDVLEGAASVLETASAAASTGHIQPLNGSVQRLGAAVASLEGVVSGSTFPQVNASLDTIRRAVIRLEDPPASHKNLQGRSRREIMRDLDNSCGSLAGSISGLLSAARMGTEKVAIYASETSENVARIVDAAIAAKLPAPASKALQVDAHVGEYLGKCDEIISNPGNKATIGPATIAIGNITKQIASGARDTAAKLEGEHQKIYVNSAKALAAGVPKLIAAVKGGKPALISKCAEFLKNNAQKMEAARQDVDVDDLFGGSDVAVPSTTQLELTASAKSVATTASEFLVASGQLASDPRNSLLASSLKAAGDAFSDAVESVATISRSLDPLKHTYQETAEVLTQAIGELDEMLVNAGMGVLTAPSGKNESKAKHEMSELVQSFAPDIATLAEKTAPPTRERQQAAERIQLKVPQLVNVTRAVAALNPNPNGAKKVVGVTNDFTKSLLLLVEDEEGVQGSRSGGAQTAIEKLGELLVQVKEAREIIGELKDVVQKVRGMSAQLEQPAQPSGRSYPEIKEQLTNAARATTSAAAALNSCDKTKAGTVSMQSKTLARTLPSLLVLIKDAVATLPEPAAKQKLGETATEMLDATAELIESAAGVADADNLANRAALSEAWASFSDAVPVFIAAAKRGAIGESAIDDGAEAIAALIGRLATIAIFAQAGQELEHVRRSAQPYEALVARVIGVTEKLVPAVQQLGKAGTFSEDQLGQAVSHFANGISALTDSAIAAADKSDDTETQTAVISATRAIAIAAKQLVLSAKDDSLAARTLTSSVASFPQAAKTLVSVLKGENKAKLAPGDLSPVEKAKKGVLDIASVKPISSSSAITLVEAARGVSAAATPLVFAATKEDLNEGATEALLAVQGLVANIKGACRAVPAAQPQLQSSGKAIAERMAELIEASSNLDRGNSEVAEKVSIASAALNQGLEGLVKIVNSMPGGRDLQLHAASDIENRTETELNAAVEYVKRIVSTLPRVVVAPDLSGAVNEKNLTDTLLHSVHVIAEATQRLISTSAAAEKESRIRGENKYRNDPTWANGLISASHKVASGVGRLVSSAEKASGGNLEEEELVANAKHVAACVKHLFMAARTRVGVSEQTQTMIGEASRGVAKATADVVKAAQHAGDLKQAKEMDSRRRSGVFGPSAIAQRLEQQTAILRLEKQLEDARRGLLRMNQAEAAAQRENK